MTAMTPCQTVERDGPSPVLEATVAAAIEGALGGLAAVEPGRLVSLSVVLPADLVPFAAGLGGDARWLAVDEDTRLYADGRAAWFRDDSAAAFRAACAAWLVLGDAAAPPPLAFWTVPPSGEAPAGPAEPLLWVPRVLLRRTAEGAVLTLSAMGDGMPPSRLATLWRAEAAALLAPRAARPVESQAPGRILATAATPADAVWAERVRAATRAIGAGDLAKVVLARRLQVTLSQPVDPALLADRLAQVHPECCVFALPHGIGHVVAASPERLAVRRGDRLTSHALAGTTARPGTPEADERAARALLATPKERREHQVVVDAIAAALGEFCDQVTHAAVPAVMRLRRIQHLWTPVSGRLRDGFGLLDAVARLHPTPAVMGFPRDAARAWLARAGERRDALYTGAAGWIDRDGNGDAAVILRSAYVEGRIAVLWAGAGIMAESDPAAELAETNLKLTTMLDLLTEG